MAGPYSTVIEATRDTIIRRAHRYKRLVILVSAGSAGLLLAAAFLRSVWPLLALGFLPSIVIGHFLLDLRTVNHWRRGALALWAAGELQLDLLATTLRQVPTLPAPTVEGMLECLPAWPGEQMPMPLRPLAENSQQLFAGIAEQVLLLRAMLAALVVTTGLLALGAGSPVWLAVWPAIPLIGLIWRTWSRRSVARARAVVECAAVTAAPAVSPDWLDQLNWQGVPPGHVAAWRRAARMPLA